MGSNQRATERHLPYGITPRATQHRWIHAALTPAMQAGTWFTYPSGMEGWVDLVWQTDFGLSFRAELNQEDAVTWHTVSCLLFHISHTSGQGIVSHFTHWALSVFHISHTSGQGIVSNFMHCALSVFHISHTSGQGIISHFMHWALVFHISHIMS